MQRPEDVFPELTADILRQRASDPEFDEICNDFELLAKNRRTEKNAGDGGSVQPDPDIEEALADLSREIKALIRRNRDTSSTELDNT